MMLVAGWYAGCVAANSATTFCKTELTSAAAGAQKQAARFSRCLGCQALNECVRTAILDSGGGP